MQRKESQGIRGGPTVPHFEVQQIRNGRIFLYPLHHTEDYSTNICDDTKVAEVPHWSGRCEDQKKGKEGIERILFKWLLAVEKDALCLSHCHLKTLKI